MSSISRQLFSSLPQPEIPSGLHRRIVERIANEQAWSIAKRRLVLGGAGMAISAIAIILTISLVWTSFAESGFYYFFSLIFSDAGIIATYWQNFTWSLLERLPVTGLALLLLTIASFLLSLRFSSRYFNTFYTHSHSQI